MVGEGDAEEAVQDALLKAHAALLGGNPVRRLAPWLHVVAHNTAVSYLRARSSRPHPADTDSECCAAADSSAEYRQELGELLAAVRSLPDRQRDAIVMRELEGRSYEEIAARLGSSHGAVRQLLHRARSSV
ncbi:MAG: sigma-70 family RNA polymerase sigma factor, partial [Actinomycetota bacterium]|nr:sigma-70 family RNA polymerase sigma factor [Actinomycetota bacterium]